jgi:hypothetical protein
MLHRLCQHGLLPRVEAEQLVAEVAKEKAASKPRWVAGTDSRAATLDPAGSQCCSGVLTTIDPPLMALTVHHADGLRCSCAECPC